MNTLKREFCYFTKDYKKVVLIFLAGVRFGQGDFCRLPRDILAMILMMVPNYDIEPIDSGFIVIIDHNGFAGWELGNRITKDFLTTGWKFTKHGRLSNDEMKAVVDTYTKYIPPLGKDPPKRALVVHEHPYIFASQEIREYCLTNAHPNNITFIYIDKSAKDIPKMCHRNIERIYSCVNVRTLSNEMGIEVGRFKEIRKFRINKVIFTEFHLKNV